VHSALIVSPKPQILNSVDRFGRSLTKQLKIPVVVMLTAMGVPAFPRLKISRRRQQKEWETMGHRKLAIKWYSRGVR